MIAIVIKGLSWEKEKIPHSVLKILSSGSLELGFAWKKVIMTLYTACRLDFPTHIFILTHSHTNTPFDTPGKQACLDSFLPFSSNLKLLSANSFSLEASQILSSGNELRYHYPEDPIFNCVISDISVVLRETTLTISDSNETGSPVKTQIVRVVSLSITERTKMTQFKKKKKIFWVWIP